MSCVIPEEPTKTPTQLDLPGVPGAEGPEARSQVPEEDYCLFCDLNRDLMAVIDDEGITSADELRARLDRSHPVTAADLDGAIQTLLAVKRAVNILNNKP